LTFTKVSLIYSHSDVNNSSETYVISSPLTDVKQITGLMD